MACSKEVPNWIDGEVTDQDEEECDATGGDVDGDRVDVGEPGDEGLAEDLVDHTPPGQTTHVRNRLIATGSPPWPSSWGLADSFACTPPTPLTPPPPVSTALALAPKSGPLGGQACGPSSEVCVEVRSMLMDPFGRSLLLTRA